MKSYLLLVLSIVYTLNIFAQTTTLKIKLTEGNEASIVGSRVVIKERKDTSKIQQAVTDTAGIVEFTIGKERQYLVFATFIGLKPLRQGLTVSDEQSSFTFVMEEQTEVLNGVEIVSKKPLMTQEDDKTVVDAEQLALTSTSALEVMEKTPGLFIDQDGNIYLTSSTPASGSCRNIGASARKLIGNVLQRGIESITERQL